MSTKVLRLKVLIICILKYVMYVMYVKMQIPLIFG